MQPETDLPSRYRALTLLVLESAGRGAVQDLAPLLQKRKEVLDELGIFPTTIRKDWFVEMEQLDEAVLRALTAARDDIKGALSDHRRIKKGIAQYRQAV